MKAVVYGQYGGPEVLHLEEVPTPAPKPDEVLVKVRAASVNYGDTLARNIASATSANFNMPMFLMPVIRLIFGWNAPKKRILGSEFSGVVEAVGSAVSGFAPGDEVFCHTEMNFGGYAQYAAVPAGGLIAKKPVNLSFPQVAVLPMGALTALAILRRVDIESARTKGKDILVNGASGSIGGFAVQIAKAYGARVTGVCGAPRLDYVRALGADVALDYARDDFTTRGEKYDVILDVLGKSSFSKCHDSLKENGVYLLASFRTWPIIQTLWTKITGGKRVVIALATYSQPLMEVIREMVETGKIKSAVDRTFPMEQATEAHRYAESGQRKGPVAITMGE